MLIAGLFRSAPKAAGTRVPAALVVFFLAISVFGSCPAIAGEFDHLPWTDAVGRVTLGNQSFNQAQEQALDLARRSAIAEVTGIQIRSLSENVSFQTGDELMTEFRQSVSAETSGHIVEESEPVYRPEQVDGNLFQIVCEIRARVALESSQPDPGFEVLVGIPGREDRKFRSGDELVLEVRASRDCWLNIFNVFADGTYALMFPNQEMPEVPLSAGRPLQIPEDEQRERMSIEVSALPDREITQEYILVVATRQERPFLSDRIVELGGGFLDMAAADPSRFARWLLAIPRDQRTQAEVGYYIYP